MDTDTVILNNYSSELIKKSNVLSACGANAAAPLVVLAGLPNTTIEQLISLSPSTSALVSFNPVVSLMEISNKTSGSLYISYSNSVPSFSTLSAAGIEIVQGAFYSIDRITQYVTIGAAGAGAVVVFGHYKA